MTTVLHTWAYDRFIEIQSNLEEKVNPSILQDDFSSRTDPSLIIEQRECLNICTVVEHTIPFLSFKQDLKVLWIHLVVVA